MEQKTYLPKVNEIERKWHVINAEGLVLGRLAVQIANILRGRNKAIYTKLRLYRPGLPVCLSV